MDQLPLAADNATQPPPVAPPKEETIEDIRQRAIADFLPHRVKGKEEGNEEESKEVSKEVQGEKVLETKEGSGERQEAEKSPPKASDPQPAEKPKANLAAKIASMAKKEQQIRLQEAKFKETEGRLKQLEEIIANAKSNPKALLDLAKINEEDYANYLLRAPEGEPEEKVALNRLGDEVKTIKEKLEKSEAERQTLQIRQAELTFRNDLKTFAETNRDRFPTVQVEREGTDLAFEIVKRYYSETGDIPRKETGEVDLDLVFEQAEEHLKSQAVQRAKAYQSLPYLKELFGSPTKQETPVSQAARQTRTLTNTPPVATPKAKSQEFRNDQERLQWAASLIKD